MIALLAEISLHLKVHQHPNIATIHQVLNIEDFAIIILMDHFEQGDLFTNIIDRQIFTKIVIEKFQNRF